MPAEVPYFGGGHAPGGDGGARALCMHLAEAGGSRTLRGDEEVEAAAEEELGAGCWRACGRRHKPR